ncbi:CBASS cGAMP-activated phospholipase [Mariniblastus fucicola]|uniref:Patatin-like phospholipase n=1 Tax=Mariniblastus fucicola TaxID=980251 RepID=A0A5B9PGS4_9BACT|nr:CBASS cGAMP-activated phospholipase [Mariniblastus fucicola]QEG22111.1 Patatin-like phospholipase [Mariniblastus fucicola]
MARFQILSLIGGGIRGAFVTSYLKELEQKLGRPIADCFDLIAGTSTGGIIAAGLAFGLSADEMHQFYVDYGASIFTEREPYRAKGHSRFWFPAMNWIFKKRTGGSLDAAFRARYCPHALENSFRKGFGDHTLGDIKCTRLIMPAVNLTKGEPHVFRSTHLPKAVHDKDIRIAEAVIATTAAPTYFPHRQIGDNAFVDGGVWAADPSMLAIAEAIRIQQFEKQQDPAASIVTNDIHLLSVGTGRAEFSLSPPGDDAGILFWASRIADVMGTSQSQGVHLPLKFFLGDRYRHVNFRMEEKWGLDDVENIPKLFAMGEQRAEETFDAINEEFLQHTTPCFVPFDSEEHEIQMKDFGF